MGFSSFIFYAVGRMLENCLTGNKTLKLLLFQAAAQSSTAADALTCYVRCPIRRHSDPPPNVALEGKWGYIFSREQ
jgi:hypothetical protein